MLMSLTMRCLPMPPADSRGTTSVVAIPNTFLFQSAGRIRSPMLCGLRRRKHLNYTALSLPSRANRAAGGPEEPALERGGKPAGLGFGLIELGDGTKLIIS